jgi:hypothetical protein
MKDQYLLSFEGMSYCGLSLNHIDQQYHSKELLIGCYPYEMENKRATTIRSFIENVLSEFGLKINGETFVMTDNEPTMKCTFNLNCRRIGCSDHYLNKQIQHAFVSKTIDGEDVNCDMAQEMFDDVKQIVANVRRMHKQRSLSKQLISYSETRFGGAYDMLVVFSDVFDELVNILDSKMSMIHSRIDRELLVNICDFLFPFVTVLESLSESKRPTLHRVLPLKQFLIDQCRVVDDDAEGLRQIKLFLGIRFNS